MRNNETPSIFLGPLDIAGYYSSLTRGLRDIGCRAQLLHLGNDKSGQWDDTSSVLPVRWYKRAKLVFDATRIRSRFDPRRYVSTMLVLLTQIVLIGWIAACCDILVLKSGESILAGGGDLRLFRRLGKRIIFIFHGSDSRPPYLNGYFAGGDMKALATWVRKIKSDVDRVACLADIILDNPLSAHFQTRQCCVVQTLGNMIDEIRLQPGFDEGTELPPLSPPRPVRILHAPSLRAIKGSDKIRVCMERLRAEGHDIDFVEVSGRPNAEVMRELARCDFVVDELYSDTHGARFSVEALAFGRPAVVCGYGKAELDRFVPAESAVPTIYARPEQLEAVIRRLVIDPTHRETHANTASDFAEIHSAAAAAARRLLLIAKGKAPESWFFDPQDIRYVHGVGGEEEVMRSLLRDYVESCGEAAMLLDDKPELKRAILAFAFGGAPQQNEPTSNLPATT